MSLVLNPETPPSAAPRLDPRRHDLDALRAAAMLLGIVYHAALAYAAGSWWMIQDPSQNLALAFGYNLVMIPFAAAGALHPAMAGAAMALSSVSVVANARRLAG